MPIGVIINSLAVLLGGLFGALLRDKVPNNIKKSLPLTFGIASMGMGVSSIVKVHTLPAVVLSLIIGSIIGELIDLEKNIEKYAIKAKGLLDKIMPISYLWSILVG